ncbi:hypothetical protein [Tenacibaculum holothuriorum]|uniref:hypothetical protein n=1 Tax=Tenacibaculum holothuriorum TaxID=1635173 RepID=UPI00117DA2C7|nr:hypothetical protein [Tenacibaculum holothuriorum]
MKNIFTLTFLFLMLFSCQKNDEITIDDSNLLLGKWSEATYNGESIEFTRVKDLPSEAYGISFEANETFKQITSGFCGTPPLTFFTSEGKWKLESSIVKIVINDFPGNFNWRILSLTEQKLIVKRELTEQEKDHRELMELFHEIETLANSISCNDSNDWSFVAYGSKACGGPKGFIAYSNKINTQKFLEKVELYTQKEREYNEKWGIISTCDVQPTPKYITCENGRAVLKY